mmetsp:Transcript_10283/g.15463  ORF Transcript_10283/g.15463 Transcript_10283/m.15463 type:complete len:524 (+) Transcript_10283:79-1650(+)
METTKDQTMPTDTEAQDPVFDVDSSPPAPPAPPVEVGVGVTRDEGEEDVVKRDTPYATEAGFNSHNLAGTVAKKVADDAAKREQLQQRNSPCMIVLAIIVGIGVITIAAVFIPRSLSKEYKYRFCNNGNVGLERIGDGTCDRKTDYWSSDLNLNTKECGYDGGDCKLFNELYKNCVTDKHPSELRDFGAKDGTCNTDYNNEACGYDAGNCLQFNAKYPNCKARYPDELGDGGCNGFEANTEECGWDGGDCLLPGLPNCTGIYPWRYNNGNCDSEFLSEECEYDGGDCQWVLENFPDCHVAMYSYLNSSICRNTDNYNTKECGWQNGACIEFNKQYPQCKARFPGHHFNNSWCLNDPENNNEECGYDGGDCIQFNKDYPNCTAALTFFLNDGVCQNSATYNNEECGWDGGDCLEFNTKYPNCDVNNPAILNDGQCDYRRGQYSNVPECDFEGGDCVAFNKDYPECSRYYTNPAKVNDGICDLENNYFLCDYDGGDCCNPSKMGDGLCDEENNLERCDYDNGDCN